MKIHNEEEKHIELEDLKELKGITDDVSEEYRSTKFIRNLTSRMDKLYKTLFLLNFLGFLFVMSLISLSIYHVNNIITEPSEQVKSVYYDYINDINESDSKSIVKKYFSERLTYAMEDTDNNLENTINLLREYDIEFEGNVLKVIETEIYYFLEVEEWFGNYEETVSKALYVFTKEDGKWKIDTIKGLSE